MNVFHQSAAAFSSGKGWRQYLPLDHPPYLQGLVLQLLFALTFIPAFTFFMGSPLRLITYGVPVANLLVWFMLSPRELRYQPRFLLALGLYCTILSLYGFLVIDRFDTQTWISALRPFFYLLMFIPFMVFVLNSLWLLIMMFAVTMLFQSLTGAATTIGDFNLAESRGLLESGLAFPLGAILLFCLRYRQRVAGAIVLFMFLAAFKRVGIVAMLLVLAVMLVNAGLARLGKIDERVLAAIAAGLFAFAGTMLNLFYYDFFALLAEWMNLDQSVMTLTMGRLNEFTILDMQSGEQSLPEILFGNGPGWATRNLIEVTITYPLQVHNSYLLYYYDFGVIGFGLFMAVFLLIYSRNTFGLYLFAYNAFIMITDNSFTHHYHQFTCFVLIGIAQSLERSSSYRHPSQQRG